MALIEITCGQCGNKAMREVGYVNRAVGRGDNFYCDRTCAGIARRTSRREKVEAKRLYDIEYRKKNKAMLKAKKKEYFKRTYDPDAASVYRAKVKKEKPEIEARRREYMASPEYKATKSKYDKEYLAKQKYGEFWECGLLAIEINKEVKSRASDLEIRAQNGTLNKCLKRKREHEKANRDQFKGSPLGNLEWN